MLNIVMFGGPGSGKGTQGVKIKDKYGLYHLSTGEVLREHIARDTEIGKTAHKYISQGQLIPDSLMLDIVKDLLDSKPEETARGIIFDGFPRTIKQAEELDRVLADRGTKVASVIGLEVPDEQLIDRMIKRGEATGRADDNIDTIKKRLGVYHNQTKPLRDFYNTSGRYARIDGGKEIDDIFDDISSLIDDLN